MVRIIRHTELDVFQRAFETSMDIFGSTKLYPREELYSLTDQIRRSSRSVSSNIAEAWRKRRYEAAFTSKLNDAEAEAAETQVWLDYSLRCGYLNEAHYAPLFEAYEGILRTLVGMINYPEQWLLPRR